MAAGQGEVGRDRGPRLRQARCHEASSRQAGPGDQFSRAWSRIPAGVRLPALGILAGLLASVTILGSPGLAFQGSQPQRIVSVVPSVTEMLFAMGAGSRVVAVSSYDTLPPEVSRLPRVGALIDPDVERIIALRPDLVVIYASQTDLKIQLDRARIATFVYRHGDLAAIPQLMRDLGARVGLAEAGALAARTLDDELDAVRTRAKGRARPRVLLVIGREAGSLRSIRASGGYGFLHDLLECAGGENVFADVKRESVDVTLEAILARAPELIIELHYRDRPSDAAVAAERAVWQPLAGVPAERDGRVVLLYGGELVVPGPRVARTAALFADALHSGMR